MTIFSFDKRRTFLYIHLLFRFMVYNFNILAQLITIDS